MRILVIEDEARLAQTLAELLHRQGYTADISGDGLSGLDNAASDIYDLVVLDAMLPGMDGFTLLRRLRTGGHAVPVLMLTARSDVADRVQGLDCGADYYLTKPFESEELLACIRSLLRRSGVLFWLDRPVADIERTLERANRPLLAGGGSLETLQRQREALYRICADYAIREDTAQAAAEVIAAIWREQV